MSRVRGARSVELPSRAPSKRTHDWERATRECLDDPGVWHLAFKNVSDATRVTVKRRRSLYLQVEGGRWESSMRNTRKRYGDLWLRWLNDTDEEIRQQMTERGEL